MTDETPTVVQWNPFFPRRIVVVNRDFPDFYRTVSEYFSTRGDIEVILDRRDGTRQMTNRIMEGSF